MAQKYRGGKDPEVMAGAVAVSLDKAVSTLCGMFPAFTALQNEWFVRPFSGTGTMYCD